MEKEYHRLEHLDYMLEHMDGTQLLEDLVRAMSNKEAKENFDFICRMRDIPY